MRRAIAGLVLLLCAMAAAWGTSHPIFAQALAPSATPTPPATGTHVHGVGDVHEPVAGVANPGVDEKRREAAQLTDALRQYARPGRVMALSLVELSSLADAARRRQAALSVLAKQDPAAVLRTALTADERSALPAAVQALVEQTASGEGSLEIMHVDREDGSGELRVWLQANGQRIPLQLAYGTDGAQTGDWVRIEGVALAGEQTVVVDQTVTIRAGARKPPTGDQRTAVILINAASTTTHPYAPGGDKSIAASLVFSSSSTKSLRAYYREASYGQLTVVGSTLGVEGSVADVYGPFSITTSGCDDDNLILQTAGSSIDYSQYDRVVVSVSTTATCSFGGYAYIGMRNWGPTSSGGTGTLSTTQYLGYALVANQSTSSTAFGEKTLNGKVGGTTIHEFGHSLVSMHSGTIDCGQRPAGGACSVVEYGDPTDVMGVSSLYGHMNGGHKDTAGWLGDGRSADVTASGSYTLTTYEQNTSGLKALRIPRSRDGSGNVNGYYYLSFRKPSAPFDTFATTYPALNNAVTVHLTGKIYSCSTSGGVTVRNCLPGYYDSGGGDDAFIVDVNPQSAKDSLDGRTPWDFKDAAIPLGGRFVDQYAGLTVELTNIATDTAALQITLDTPRVSISSFTQPNAGGTVTGTGTYTAGQNVSLTAVPAPGYRFLRWVENDRLTSGQLGSTNPFTFTAQGDRLIEAVFEALPSTSIDHDAFARAATLPLGTPVTANTSTATTETGEPTAPSCLAGGATVGKTLWYRFTPRANMGAIFSTTGSDFDTVLTVYTGSSLGALTPVACNDDSGAPQSQVSINVTADTAYLVQVGGKNGASGALRLSATATAPANDNIANAAVITSLPVRVSANTNAASMETGEPTCYGTSGPSIWYRFTASTSQTVSLSLTGTDFNAEAVVYQGDPFSPSNFWIACGLIWYGSDNGEAKFSATAGSTYYFRIGGYSGASGNVRLSVNGGTAPSNDAFASAATLNAGTLVQTSVASATTETNEPQVTNQCATVARTLWYRFTSPATVPAPVTLSTAGSDFDSVLAVYTGTDITLLTRIGCNDDSSVAGGTGTQSRLTFMAQPNVSYAVQVGVNAAYSLDGGTSLRLLASVGRLALVQPSAGCLANVSCQVAIQLVDADGVPVVSTVAGSTATLSASGGATVLPAGSQAFTGSLAPFTVTFPSGGAYTLTLSASGVLGSTPADLQVTVTGDSSTATPSPTATPTATGTSTSTSTSTATRTNTPTSTATRTATATATATTIPTPIPNPNLMQVAGTVTLDGSSVSAGTIIQVVCRNGVTAGLTQTGANGVAANAYQVTVYGRDTSTTGTESYCQTDDTMQFFVNGFVATTSVTSGAGTWSGAVGSNAVINLAATSSITQTLNLSAGWNLVSLRVAPSSYTPAQLVTASSNIIDIVLGFDASAGQARSYFTDPNKSILNNLNALQTGAGYWVHATTAGSASAQGTPTTTVNKSLVTGWNLMGWQSGSATPVLTALSSLGGNWDVTLGFDAANGQAQGYFTDSTKSVLNSLSQLQPGGGYWIHATGPATWSYGIGAQAVTAAQQAQLPPAASPTRTAAAAPSSTPATVAASVTPSAVVSATTTPTVTPTTVRTTVAASVTVQASSSGMAAVGTASETPRAANTPAGGTAAP